MEYQYLGKSGLEISKIILGCMSFGNKEWRGPWVLDDEDEVLSLMKQAYDVGIRTFDTANLYSDGESETFVGKFLKKYDIPRTSIVIMSKVYFPCHDDPRLSKEGVDMNNRTGLSRKHIMDACEASIKRLGTYIDVYQIHRYDENVPREEVMKALHDLVEAGKVRYIGASTMRAIEFAQYQFCAEKNGWTKFISMQNYYNLVYREEEREMIPYCKENGVGLIPWSPIARGVLAKPLDAEKSVRNKTDFYQDYHPVASLGNNAEIIKRVEKVAKDKQISMAMVSIAWTLAKGICPIVGFNKPERIEEAVKAVSVKLSEEEIKYLEEPYSAIYPIYD